MSEKLDPKGAGAPGHKLVPKMLNHAGWITKDMAATADFYHRILGMEIGNAMVDDRVPSTGEPFPHLHLFFCLGDGSTVAFFETPTLPPASEPSHPAYDIFNHFAMQVDTKEEIHQWKKWLEQNGVAVVGPTDHKGDIYSIYFRDPNGIRLELTAPTDPSWNRRAEKGRHALKRWVETKESAQRSGEDVGQALSRLAGELREQY